MVFHPRQGLECGIVVSFHLRTKCRNGMGGRIAYAYETTGAVPGRCIPTPACCVVLGRLAGVILEAADATYLSAADDGAGVDLPSGWPPKACSGLDHFGNDAAL